MDIKNLVTERVGAFLGQKSANPHALLTNADCEKIENFVSRRGRLRKIWGTNLYAEFAYGAGEIKWIDYFRDLWIFQRGNKIAREQTEGAANFVEIGEIALGEQNRIRSDKWSTRLFLSNGVENKFLEDFDGSDFFANLGLSTLVHNLGITPPGNGARPDVADPLLVVWPETSSVADLGSTLANATYHYLITWWDDDRQTESLCNGAQVNEDGLWISFPRPFGQSSAIVFAGNPNNSVKVDITKLKAIGYDERVTHFNVYRATQADPNVFKRVNTTPEPIASNFYVDRTLEAALGAVLDESISPPPTGLYYQGYGVKAQDQANIGPRFVKFFRDQLWFFGVNLPGTEFGWEANSAGTGLKRVNFLPQSGILYGSQVDNPDYFQYTYGIGRASDQRDTGMGKHNNTLILFKEGSAYYLDGTSPDNYAIRELDIKRGITVPGSLAETTAGIIGIGAEGFTLFDSIGPAKIISEEITDMVEQINLEQAEKITAAFDPVEEKYECHCPMKNTYNTLVFIYDLKSRCWAFLKRAGGAAHYGLNSNRRTVGLLGDALNGRLYLTTDRSAVTFNDQTMHGVWRSKHFDFNAPGKLKALKMVTIVARAKWDFRLSIDVIPDFAQRDCVSVKDIAPDLRGDVLAENQNDPGGALWNEGQWAAGTEKKEFTILIEAVAKKFQLIVRNSDRDADRASFEIEEIILHAELLDGDDD